MAKETQQIPTTPEAPASSSCYKKKPEASTFFENVGDRFDEFVHASMEEHKACFKNTIKKVSEMPKAIKERISQFKEARSFP